MKMTILLYGTSVCMRYVSHFSEIQYLYTYICRFIFMSKTIQSRIVKEFISISPEEFEFGVQHSILAHDQLFPFINLIASRRIICRQTHFSWPYFENNKTAPLIYFVLLQHSIDSTSLALR